MTPVDPEVKRLLLDEARAEGGSEELVSTIEAMLDDGRLVPALLPDGSLGIGLGPNASRMRETLQ